MRTEINRISEVDTSLFAAFNEGAQWGEWMQCGTVAELNDQTDSGKIRELIRENEALHKMWYAQIVAEVLHRQACLVLLAGPSSSGKTTSAHRLATQLRNLGKEPVLMSLDDYYLDRHSVRPGPDGNVDLEHIQMLDTALFKKHLRALLNDEIVELPVFNFLTGKREWTGHCLRLKKNSVIIVEGLHALNPMLLPDDLPQNTILRVYISPFYALSLDCQNSVSSDFLRLVRRIVRDHNTRGSTVQQTINMWDSVRTGEKRWILPFRENADIVMNSATLYEIAVLKKRIYPLLTEVGSEDDAYERVRDIAKVLSNILEADVDDEIPPNSIVREFIGGSCFSK